MPSSLSDKDHTHNTMTLTGHGKVTTVPDIAIIRLGVQTTGENLLDIQSENAQISQAVLQALQQMGITDIKTFQYVIDKLYDYQDGIRIDRGYSVRNILEIRTRNMDQVGYVIDTAVSRGANVVEFINFEVSDIDNYYLQALNLALMNASQKAKSISMSMGLLLNPIPIRITENSAPPIPFSQFYSMRESLATPIEPGTKQIEASVTVVYIY